MGPGGAQPETPASRIALVRFSKLQQIGCSKVASRGTYGPRSTIAALGASKDRGYTSGKEAPAAYWPCFPPSTSMEGSMNAVSSLVLAAIFSGAPGVSPPTETT